MTTKTEQIIAEYLDPLKGGTDAALISELRRISALCAAYWREIESLRKVRRCACSPEDEPYSDRFHEAKRASNELTEATDAARREAGEGQ